MWNRNEVEALIVFEVRELERLESNLDQRLANVPDQVMRLSLVRDLMDLERKTSQLEELVDAFDGLCRTAPIAA
jgi:hypothetical protein